MHLGEFVHLSGYVHVCQVASRLHGRGSGSCSGSVSGLRVLSVLSETPVEYCSYLSQT